MKTMWPFKKVRYDYFIVDSASWNIDRDIKRMEADGWETCGEMSTRPVKNKAWCSQPMRRKSTLKFRK